MGGRMKKGGIRVIGRLEEYILLAIHRGNTYGVAINRDISERINKKISAGAVYLVLSRLEEKGYLKSRAGAATAKKGGRAKRLYILQRAGVRGLIDVSKESEKMWAGVSFK